MLKIGKLIQDGTQRRPYFVKVMRTTLFHLHRSMVLKCTTNTLLLLSTINGVSALKYSQGVQVDALIATGMCYFIECSEKMWSWIELDLKLEFILMFQGS